MSEKELRKDEMKAVKGGRAKPNADIPDEEPKDDGSSGQQDGGSSSGSL